MNSNFSAESDFRDQIHMTSDELSLDPAWVADLNDPAPKFWPMPDFSRVVNEDALTPEVVDLISKLESFQ